MVGSKLVGSSRVARGEMYGRITKRKSKTGRNSELIIIANNLSCYCRTKFSSCIVCITSIEALVVPQLLVGEINEPTNRNNYTDFPTLLKRYHGAINNTINIRERWIALTDSGFLRDRVTQSWLTRYSPLKIYSLVKSQYWFWHRTSYVRSVYAMLFPVSW